MRTLKLTIAYDGARFSGWQLQANARTVQGAIEEGLLRLCRQPLRPTAAGRTDAGVHAEGQVLSLAVPDEVTLPAKAFVFGLNGFLPEDVAVLDAAFVRDGFDARRDSRGKRYRYRILNRRTRHPLTRASHWVIFPRLAVAPMQAAASRLVGTHDFAAFRAADCDARTTERSLHRVVLEPGRLAGELVLEVDGTAFLKHMVRNLVGTLVKVGRGQLTPEDMPRLIAGRDRTRAGVTAPAHGLTLVEVRYD